MSADKPIIELHQAGVCYRLGRGFLNRKIYWPLRGLDLKVVRGETLGVIGRNGAGKTTLLQLLVGILSPDSGTVVRRVERISLLSLQAGFVPLLSGRINAIMSGMLLGFRKQEMVRLMPDIVRFAELEEFIDQPVRTYSMGMRARLGFAVAHHLEPDLLLIDEVLGVGDAAFREKSAAIIREKIRSRSSVVLVSHSPATLKQLCDRVVWLRDGRVYREGVPEAVLSEYVAVMSAEKKKNEQ